MPTPGDRIKAARDEKGWTQEELARRSAISKGFLSDVENNKRNVSADNALKIADALGVSLDFLMRGEQGKEEDARRPVSIPPELSAAAVDLGLSYTDTLTLLETHEAVAARRSNQANKQPKIEDWKRLHHALKEAYSDGAKSRK